MPVTVRNADILFNDGTTQSTAAGALTTTAVLNATAGASLGAVGAYAFLGENSFTTTTAPGETRAGSALRYAGLGTNHPWSNTQSRGATVATGPFNSAPAGTWRCMGYSLAQSSVYEGNVYPATLWLRIS